MRLQPAMGPLDWGLLLLLSVLWGGSFFFSKLAVRDLPPLTIVLVRVGLAALALAGYLRVTGRHLPRAKPVWAAFFGMGFLNNLVPFSLLVSAQTELASGLAAILNATTPIFSVIVAHCLTDDEKISVNKLAGIGCGFAGVAVLFAGDLGATHPQPFVAMLACLGAAMSYGFAGVFGRRFRRLGIAPVSVAFGQTTAAALMVLPLALVVDKPWRLAAPGAATCFALLGLALLSTALAYILFFRILAAGGAVMSSLVTLLVPVSAILLGSIVLGERLDAHQFAGIGLIALGLLVIDGRIFAPRRGLSPT